MIVTISSHGRSKKDCAAVVAHVLKTDENDFVKVAEIGNSSATTLDGVVTDMQLQRDGSAANVSLHHITVNPGENCTEKELMGAANAMRLELDPDNLRPYAIIIHGKKRQGLTGSDTHAHVLLGHVFSGIPLKDRLSKRRTEMVARICEYNLREHCTLGPGHRYAINRLRTTAPHIAQWMIDAHGENPEKPRSAMSANTRQRAKRVGVDLPKAKARVVAAWQLAPEPSAFRAALKADGFTITTGKKNNVLLVVDANGNLIGAVDRLLRKKRHEVLYLLETDNGIGENEIEHRERAADDRARAAIVQPEPGDQRKAESVGATADAAGTSRAVRGGGPDRGHSTIPGVLGAAGRATDRVTPDDRRKARRVTRFARYRALKQLRSLGQRLAKSEGLAHYCWPPDDYIWNGAVSIWGIPIEPPKRFQP